MSKTTANDYYHTRYLEEKRRADANLKQSEAERKRADEFQRLAAERATEIDELRVALDEARDGLEQLRAAMGRLAGVQTENERLQKRMEEMRLALVMYADRKNWHSGGETDCGFPLSPIWLGAYDEIHPTDYEPWLIAQGVILKGGE